MPLSPSTLVAFLTQLIGVVPPWLCGVALIVVLVLIGLPRLVRALDDHRIVTAAVRAIRSERGALEALRTIRPQAGRQAPRGRHRA